LSVLLAILLIIHQLPTNRNASRHDRSTRPSTTTPSSRTVSSTNSSSTVPPTSATTHPAPLRRLPSLPVVLWSQPWTPTGSRFPEAIPLNCLKQCAYTLATSGGDVDDLRIKGRDVKELVRSFNRALALAARLGDFTDILVPVRDFVM
jgi:hypothetical protein